MDLPSNTALLIALAEAVILPRRSFNTSLSINSSVFSGSAFLSMASSIRFLASNDSGPWSLSMASDSI